MKTIARRLSATAPLPFLREMPHFPASLTPETLIMGGCESRSGRPPGTLFPMIRRASLSHGIASPVASVHADEDAPDAVPIVRGEGVYLYTEDGRRLLDGISSWWVNIHGHAHPKLNEALAAQAGTLEHVVFAGCTHEPAVAWPND